MKYHNILDFLISFFGTLALGLFILSLVGALLTLDGCSTSEVCPDGDGGDACRLYIQQHKDNQRYEAPRGRWW